MIKAIRGSALPSRDGSFQLGTAPAAAFLEGLVQAQRFQWEALNSWQQVLAAMNQELWDEWVCHCAGGAPIDV